MDSENQNKTAKPSFLIHEITSKSDYKYKNYLLLSLFLLQFGSLYAYQDFSTNHDYYQTYFAQKSDLSAKNFEFHYNTVYSISLFCLMYFAVKTGVLCDHFGSGVVILAQWGFMVLGCGIVYLGVYQVQFVTLMAGRMLIFMANSTMFISTGTFIQGYYLQSEQAGAQSVMNTSILALFVNLNVATVMQEGLGLVATAGVVFGMAVGCFLLALWVYRVDRRLEIEINGEEEEQEEDQQDQDEQEQEQDYQYTFNQQNQNANIRRKGTSKDISLSKFYEQMKNYPTAFLYFMCSIFLTLTVSTIVEIVGPAFLTSYYKITPVTAGQICSLAPLTSIFLVFFGKIVDKFKSHTLLNIVQCFLHGLALILLPNTEHPAICFLLYGLGYCLRMMLSFPIQAIFVPKIQTGTVYAYTRASKDFIGFFITLINGWIAQNYGYEPVIYISVGISALAMLFAILLHRDYQRMINNNDLYFLKLQEINIENDLIKRKKTNQEDAKSIQYQQFLDENSFVAVGMTNLKYKYSNNNRDCSNISRVDTIDQQ